MVRVSGRSYRATRIDQSLSHSRRRHTGAPLAVSSRDRCWCDSSPARTEQGRRAVYPSAVYRCEFARTCSRDAFPIDDRQAVGPSTLEVASPLYHPFRLREHIELGSEGPVGMPVTPSDYCHVTTIREVL